MSVDVRDLIKYEDTGENSNYLVYRKTKNCEKKCNCCILPLAAPNAINNLCRRFSFPVGRPSLSGDTQPVSSQGGQRGGYGIHGEEG